MGYFCKKYTFWYSSKIYSGTGTAYFSTYQQQPKESHSVSKLRRIGILVPRSWELLKKKMRKYLGGSGDMLPWKILKVETKICAVWGILEANLKKSSTLKFIMNISFLTSICIHRSIIWIFIGKKVCLSIFSNKIFFFTTFISARILVSATKLANIKIIWSKLETKEQTKFWFIGPYLVTPGTESLTRHIDLLDAVTHTHLRLANLAKHKPVSTFSFSHLQNFHLFFTDASISDTSAFLPFASTTRKDEIYDQVVGSLSGQVFQSSCHQLASSGNIVD